jgi:hypothetical protein
MQYQLVLQYSEERYGDLDWIIHTEDFLIAMLREAEVDGHDMGVGEVNIFLNTNIPIEAFNRIKDLFEKQDHSLIEDCKAGYRDFNLGDYIPLWPTDLKTFEVK